MEGDFFTGLFFVVFMAFLCKHLRYFYFFYVTLLIKKMLI